MGIKMLTLGEKFPEMEVQTTHGRIKLPDHYRDTWFVLFSYSVDFTPLSTTELVAFAKRYRDFKQLNTELIGLSVDSVLAHLKWIEWIEENLKVKIPYPLIADLRGYNAEMLGLIHAVTKFETVRAVYIVNPKGTISAILFYPLDIGRNVYEILRIVKAFQVSEKYKASIPANWPNNELVGDKVIVSLPHTREEAEKRLKEYECFDWWFCYKEVSMEEAEAAREFLEKAAKKP
jgi:peroxiredoxin (alkyl hydroperoxide reductase subunit C)